MLQPYNPVGHLKVGALLQLKTVFLTTQTFGVEFQDQSGVSSDGHRGQLKPGAGGFNRGSALFLSAAAAVAADVLRRPIVWPCGGFFVLRDSVLTSVTEEQRESGGSGVESRWSE